MEPKGTVVMEHERIGYTIRRFAQRIKEEYYKEKMIVILGVKDNGLIIAHRIVDHLSAIDGPAVSLMSVSLDKMAPLDSPMHFEGDVKKMKGRTVILVDDVLNSGRTLVHTLGEVLQYGATKVSTYVLVDRIHRSFPVKADHVGMSLSTTVQERVEVDLRAEGDYAYLT